MHQEILKWLREDKSFDAAVQLFYKHGNNEGFKRTLNKQGFTTFNEGLLHEELKKIIGLEHNDFFSMLAAPKLQIVEKIEDKELAKGGNPDNKIEYIDIPVHIKKTIKLREEFPFLGEADCPDVLKVLVGDMITAYNNYKAEHEKLFLPENEALLSDIAASVVDDYLEDKLILDELNYYKENKELLGQHDKTKVNEGDDDPFGLKDKTLPDLIVRQTNLLNYINKNVKKIEEETAKNPESTKIEGWQTARNKQEAELEEVKRLILGFDK